jgi:hypothetical protein
MTHVVVLKRAWPVVRQGVVPSVAMSCNDHEHISYWLGVTLPLSIKVHECHYSCNDCNMMQLMSDEMIICRNYVT